MEYILEFILEYLWESILGLVGAIILAVFGYKKISKSNSQENKIKGDGNTVNNSNEQNESHDGHAVTSGQGNIAIVKAQNVSINQDNSNVQMPIEEFKRRIELERNDAVEEYKKAITDSEKEEPLRKITEFDKRLADLPKYYQEAQKLISNSMSMLISIFDGKTLHSRASAERFMEAVDAIEGNDLSKADECFADMETYKELNPTEVSNLAFTRGKIAEHEIRWQDAAKHYARAAQLDPCFRNLIFAEKLANSIGDYDSALSLGMKAQKSAIADYGEGTREHALALNNLAGIYESQGQAKKAKPFYEQALNIYKEIFGETGRQTATSLNNLAKCYADLGRDEEAEQLYLQSIDICKKNAEKNHLPLASALGNLALLYLERGLHKKAESLCKEALKIRQKSLNKNHPSIANSLNNLAGIYNKQKRYKNGSNFYLRALKILEATLGSDHPHTKLTKANYKATKKYIAKIEKPRPQ